MPVDIVKIPSRFPLMTSGPFEESWNRIADMVFADAGQQGLNSLTVYLPESWEDMQWLTLRMVFLPQNCAALRGALWIGGDRFEQGTDADRIYWVHHRAVGANPSRPPVQSYSIWTRPSRYWGAGVRIADMVRATALRDRLMSRAQGDFVQPGRRPAQFHLDIFQREEAHDGRRLVASDG